MELNIKEHIVWDLTLAQFGQPQNNSSNVIIRCYDCDVTIITSILCLKARLKRRGILLCSVCNRKRVYTDERRKQLSDRTKELWENPKFRENQIKVKKDLWQTPEYIENQRKFKTKEFRTGQSEKQKLVVQREGYRDNQSKQQTLIWQNEEYRDNQSKQQKSVWQREGYKDHQKTLQKDRWQDPEYRKHYEDLWRTEEYKTKLSNIAKTKWQDPEFQIKACKAAKNKWNNSEYRDSVVSGLKRRWQDPEYRELKILQSKELWKDDKFREKMGKIRSAQMGRKSSIEKITELILNSVQIKHKSQVPIGPYLFDYFLPDHNVYIECQGEYWHSLPNRQCRDASKYTYLEKFDPSARILYLYEHEFSNPHAITSKINNFIVGHEPEIEQKQFNLSDIRIFTVNAGDAVDFLNSYHYAAFGRSSKIIYGAFLESQCIAICKFSSVIREEVATSMNINPRQVLELDRFCIHPGYQKKNFASWFLSRISRSIFQDPNFGKIVCLVSFADKTYGHFGTIYKAANWDQIGIVRPDYYYIGEDGFILHKKTLYNRACKMSMKEKEYADKHNYHKSFGKEKIKFMLKRNVTVSGFDCKLC